MEKSGASVVVVNLYADVEAHLDEVYSLLDDDRYNELREAKNGCVLTKFGDVAGAKNPHLHAIGRT